MSASSVATRKTIPTMRTALCSSGKSFCVGRGEDQPAHARVVEERLDDDEAADQVAGLRRDDGDRRQERVAQDVPADDGAPRQPLEHGGARVVGVERLDRAGPRDPGDVAEEHDHERQRGQEEVLELREEARARRARAR